MSSTCVSAVGLFGRRSQNELSLQPSSVLLKRDYVQKHAYLLKQAYLL